jgi:hypothetical protein
MGFQCRHGEVTVQFFDQNCLSFFVFHQGQMYTMHFRNIDTRDNELLIVGTLASTDKPIRLKIVYSIFPPEQAPTKLNSFLNLLAFS